MKIGKYAYENWQTKWKLARYWCFTSVLHRYTEHVIWRCALRAYVQSVTDNWFQHSYVECKNMLLKKKNIRGLRPCTSGGIESQLDFIIFVTFLVDFSKSPCKFEEHWHLINVNHWLFNINLKCGNGRCGSKNCVNSMSIKYYLILTAVLSDLAQETL